MPLAIIRAERPQRARRRGQQAATLRAAPRRRRLPIPRSASPHTAAAAASS
jgi:hypothetical protein